MEGSRSASRHVTPSHSSDGEHLKRADLPVTSGQPERPHLGLWDAVSIIVGIVIGSTIYKSPQMIMANVSEPSIGLLAWALGGALSLVGALCYAELATTYPRSGGDYVYLSRAFGDWCGFLFGWAQLAVIITSSIAMMAFVFGDYAVKVWPPPETVVPEQLVLEQEQILKGVLARNEKPDESDQLKAVQDQIRPYGTRRELWAAAFAAAAVAMLALANILGVALGKWTQNLLSLAKVAGLGAIVWAGFQYGQADVFKGLEQPSTGTSFGFAMVLVLYAYGGWNHAAFVAAEVRRRRDILRSLVIGIAIITVVYLAVNVAYLRALGFQGMRASGTVAADVGQMALGRGGAQAISILVMVSALGAIDGLTFTGSRVYSTMGAENSIFSLLGRWHATLKTPVWSLSCQAAVALAMILAVGTPFGRDAIDACLSGLGMSRMPWDKYFGGFDTLLAGTAPVFWAFFLLTGLSLFALRQRDPEMDRPFKVPSYPLLPLIFCGYCGYMLYSALDYSKAIALIGAIPLLLGLPLYMISRRRPPLAPEPAVPSEP
jgi:amino acid transporter